MALKSQAATQAGLDAMNALADGGILRVYSGTIPTTADEAIGAQVAQADFTLSTPAYGPSTGTTTATATLTGLTKTATVTGAGGLVSFARLLTSGGAEVEQYTVGAPSGFEVNFDESTWANGATVNITSLDTTMVVA